MDKSILRMPGQRVAAPRRYSRLVLTCATFLATAASTSSVLGAVGISGWVFGEGYTSRAPGSPVEIRYRAFSLGNMREICDASPVPTRLSSSRDPIRLRIGDRIERSGQIPGNSQDDVVVEAYDARGDFLSRVPIIITVVDPRNVMGLVSEGDYLEAMTPGEAEFQMTWACGLDASAGMQASVRITVTD